MLDRKYLDNIEDINSFRLVQKELLKMGVSIEIVERCAPMEMLLSNLTNADISVKGDTVIAGDTTIKVVKGGVEIYNGEDNTTTIALNKKDNTVVISTKDDRRIVDEHGAIVSIESEDAIFNAKRIELDDGTPYVQSGTIAIDYHIDDGNPEFISSAISTYYNYERNMARYPRLKEWYISRWGKDFSIDTLRQDVEVEIEADREYRQSLDDDYTGEGM